MASIAASSIYEVGQPSFGFGKASIKNSSRRETDEVLETFIVIPPDGGWGWVIVAASFFCGFVEDGVIFCFGIFLNEISEHFNVHPTKIAIANSLLIGFFSLWGPVVCGLINRFGFRKIGFIGGLIASLTFVVITFVDNFTYFALIYGLMGGLSFSMVYVPSIICVSYYFDRWRALAISFAVFGASVGVICFPFFINNELTRKYNWKFKFRMLAIFCIFCSLCALLYRPLKPMRVIGEEKRVQFLTDSASTATFNMEATLSEKFTSNFHHNKAYPTVFEIQSLTKDMSESSSVFVMSIPVGSLSFIATKDGFYTPEEENISYNQHSRKGKCFFLRKCFGKKDFINKQEEVINRPMYRDDIFFTGSVFTLPEYSRKMSKDETSVKKSMIDYHMSVTRAATQKDIQESCVCCPVALKRTLATMLDFSLLKSPSFVLLSLSSFFSVFGLYIPYVYIIERALQKKIDKNMTYYLLSILGVSNGVGRLICGAISCFSGINNLLISYISLLLCGLITIVSICFNDIYGQYFYCTIYGLTLSTLACLRTPIIVEIFGLEKLTNTLGISMIFQGIASFMGLPIAGVVYKLSETYDSCFIMAGAAIALSGILLIPIKAMLRKEKQ